ncbi:hypothetical protein J4456_00510 [Candidatus Pacearchaeota archaeon]|nr:hypothetical protein [Candidatus Pacearchaeota archaeon]
MIEGKNHILKILEGVKLALDEKNYIKLKNLSNESIEHASIHQDPDVISITVLIYALSKLIEREKDCKENCQPSESWSLFFRKFKNNIIDMTAALQKDNSEKFRNEVKANRQLLENVSGKLKEYISDVFQKARINKASKMYEQGISMGKTASILGISIWELAEYTGSKPEEISITVTLPISKRLQLTKELFEL